MIRKILLASTAIIICSQTVFAYNTPASHAILMDYDTGAVLFSKKPDAAMIPSSMSKLMTLYLVFQALRDGIITQESIFTVSENAYRHGGADSSLMFLQQGQKVSVLDLLKGTIVASGNDAAVTLAENLAGSEDEFVKEMNLKAAQLGLRNTNFKNSTGLPHDDHVMSARDLAVLCHALMRDFPEYMPMFIQKEFVFNKVKQSNRNHLLYSIPSQAEGLKTGHTLKGGYGLAAAAHSKDGARRLIMVINGLKSQAARATESVDMMTYGMGQFNNYTLFQDGYKFDEVDVFMGDKASVEIITSKPIVATLPKATRKTIEVSIEYIAPVKAPVKRGDVIGILRINHPEMDQPQLHNLTVQNDVGKIGFFRRLWVTALFYMGKL